MNIDTLLDNIVTALSISSTINTWTMMNYTRMVTVYKGIDINNEPGESAYPIIYVHPLTKDTGYDKDKIVHEVGITCGIYKESSTTSNVEVDGFEGTATKVVYAGVALLEAFRKLIETAVLAADMNNMLGNSLEIVYDTVKNYPFFIAHMVFELNQDLYQGSSVFA